MAMVCEHQISNGKCIKVGKYNGECCPFERREDCDILNETKPAADVAHQVHYESLSIQPIEVAMRDLSPEEFKGSLKKDILKYVLRKPKPDDPDKTKDYAKARQYACWLCEYSETGTIAQFNKRGVA